MKFALITEGPSEHKIIKHTISKFFKDYDPDINQIQPKLIDGKQDKDTPGGWNEVLKYCSRDELVDIFIENDYLVIQIDTDNSQIEPFNVSHRHDEAREKTVDELCDDIATKLKSLFKEEIKNKYSTRIFFAICVHTIECWLLPIFYNDKRQSKIANCIDSLNLELEKKDIHKITSSNKNEPNGVRSYEIILKAWKRKEDIIKSAQYNHGFKIFVDSLGTIPLT